MPQANQIRHFPARRWSRLSSPALAVQRLQLRQVMRWRLFGFGDLQKADFSAREKAGRYALGPRRA
jgi:hypothetical protein